MQKLFYGSQLKGRRPCWGRLIYQIPVARLGDSLCSATASVIAVLIPDATPRLECMILTIP